jgi:competence protein ComGC
MAKIGVMKELWDFIKHNKKFWLIPVVVILVLIGLLIVLSAGSPVAPFIYTLF